MCRPLGAMVFCCIRKPTLGLLRNLVGAVFVGTGPPELTPAPPRGLTWQRRTAGYFGRRMVQADSFAVQMPESIGKSPVFVSRNLRPLLISFMPKGLTGNIRRYGRLFGQAADFGQGCIPKPG
jgi:hypothetical protein